MKYFIIILLVAFMASNAGFAQTAKKAKKETTAKAKVEPEFEQFWKEFKDAVSKKDKNKITDMTNFPFVIYNYLTQTTNKVTNSNEFANKKFEEYSSSALESILSEVKLIKQIKSLVKPSDRIDLSIFKLTNNSVVYIASKDYCDLVISKVNGKIKLFGVVWTPAE